MYVFPANEHYVLVPPAMPPAAVKAPSLEDILELDTHTLLDKAVQTALSISYRLTLYRQAAYLLTNQWNELSQRLGEYQRVGLYGTNSLYKERRAVEHALLDHKIQTWKDLNEPIRYFTELTHKRAESLTEQKLLGGQA